MNNIISNLINKTNNINFTNNINISNLNIYQKEVFKILIFQLAIMILKNIIIIILILEHL